jgi:hypothetical protein
MGRFELTSEKKPSVWDRRKRYQGVTDVRTVSARAQKRAAPDPEDLPPNLPEDCTWVGVFGIHDEPVSKATGDLFEAAARARGAPFVVWERDTLAFPEGAIPVVVLNALPDNHEAVRELADTFGKYDDKGRALIPFQFLHCRANDANRLALGPALAKDVDEILDMAIAMRDDAARAEVTETVADIAETAKPAND